MKKILLSVLTSATALSLHAQQQDYRLELRDQLVNSIMKQQAATTRVAAKTTGSKERLISTKSYFQTGATYVLFDSAVLHYSGTKGSLFDFNKMIYNIYSLPDQSDYPTLYMHTTSPNDIADVLYDSAQDYTFSSGTVSIATSYYRQYSGNFTSRSSYTYYDTMQSGNIYSYNASGDVTSIVNFTRSPSSYDTSYISYFSYNSSEQLIRDSGTTKDISGIYKPYFKESYGYDASGHISDVTLFYVNTSTSGWQPYSKYLIDYNAAGKVNTVSIDTGISFVQYYKTTYSYTPGVNYYTGTTDSLWSGTNWQSYATMAKYLNAAHLPDSMVSIYALGYKTKHVYRYDAANNITVDTTYTITSGSTSANFQQYFYEAYPDAVHDVKLPSIAVQLYPNPATSIMNINMQNTTGNTPLQLSIYNEQGQIVKRAFLNTLNGHAIMHIEDLASGIYFVNIQANGYSVNTQKLIKQ